MEYSNEQLERAVQSLPKEFQEAIASSNISDKVLEIGKRYNLHVDQMGKLKDTAMLATLNLISPTNFSETLSKELFLPITKAQALVGDINKEIFEKIKERIRENTKKEIVEEESKIVEPPIEIVPQPQQNLDEPTNEKLNKEDVLRGIEDEESQQFTRQNFSNKNLGGQATNNNRPNFIAPTGIIIKNIPSVLSEKVSVPPPTIQTQKKPAKETPPSPVTPPKIDPYREPIH